MTTVTHETIPKAWYSMIEDRDIRVRRPCCMPRSKRKIATFGDGCGGRGALHDCARLPLAKGTHHFDINSHLSHGEPWDENAAGIGYTQ